MFCLQIYDFLKFCAVHLSEPVLEPNRTGRTGSKLFCSGSGSVLANKLRFWFSVLKKWSENRTEPNFGNTSLEGFLFGTICILELIRKNLICELMTNDDNCLK